MHRTRTMCSDNRSVRKIEVWIIEVRLYLAAALNTPTLINIFLVRGSTSEGDFPPNKFVADRALDCKELRVYSDVGGNYPSGGTDVCPWADVQVSAYQAISQVDPCIQESHFIRRP